MKELSFALSNWVEYIAKYHFLYKIYMIDFFKEYPRVQMELKDNFLESIYSGYYLIQGLLKDPSYSNNFDFNILPNLCF